MKRNIDVKNAATAVYNEVLEGLLSIEENNKELLETLGSESIDTGLDKVVTLTRCIALQVYGTNVDGVHFPEFLFSIDGVGDTCDNVRVSIRSKQKATVRLKKKISVSVNADYIEVVGKEMLNMAVEMYYTECALENLEALNEVLDAIYETGEIDKKVHFAINEKSGRVISITNDELVLRADLNEALQISQLGIMAAYGQAEEDVSEFDAMVSGKAKEEFMSVMKTCQTTQEILKKHITIVEKLADLRTRKSAYRLIREGYHMQVKNVAKGATGYVHMKVGEIDVFSLVHKDADGNLTVVLNPFDTTTNEPVDVDILKEIA